MRQVAVHRQCVGPCRDHPRGLRLGAILVFSVSALSCGSAPAGPSSPPPASSGPPQGVDCSVFPARSSAIYVLPWAVGRRFEVTLTFGHYTPLNGGVGLYAVDFLMPIGTPIHAARAGTVVALEERFTDNDRADFTENWVMIRHADNTIGRYIHLTRDGALVEVGEEVAQGQVVGLAGSSGTAGSHLHFDVQTCGPNLPPGYNRLPCGMTIPVTFRNTEPHACGLELRRSYTAEGFEPDAR
jgi:murein DD-endopeptidase MepM/ murein hydrolase activator NlpD